MHLIRIGVIGATGMLGVASSLRSGRLRAPGESPYPVLTNAPDPSPAIELAAVDALDGDRVTAAIGGLDLLISAYQPGNAAKHFNDVLRRSIEESSAYVTAATALLKTQHIFLKQADRNRQGRKPRDQTRSG